ncbi:acetylornithine transaminase [Agromyces mariniharenae]|uniref:Acetylornithine transaminase n=1 Tax=Agromyces mariniharenae TaxID=2604423 RepID=A0A5S4V1T6_9MICO|nr:acetylornithine transaminase [Agromyces mariniharenae]TYL52208.1 acetylornithine transaminase [Agromyces mariniharenae]
MTDIDVLDWQARFDRRIMRSIGMPLAKLDHGRGARVWDDAGHEYLDFLAGIAVNSLGHAHPVFVEAVTAQASRLAHVSNYFTTEPALELAERLIRLAGAGEHGRAWFGNSGAEANEAAFKLARLNNSGGARSRVVALVDGFHGRTMGSLALTGKPHMREAFEPLPGGVEHIPATIAALEATIDESVAALFVEPIQGEAGVVELPDGFMTAARELTERHGALLIVDEIQTGAGRTGQWFGFQHSGITPDAITVAKGIGGGFPIGGLVTFGRASSLYSKGQHGSTFGGNPLATAVANAVLDEIETGGLVENAAARGGQIRERVDAIGSPLVTGTRGRGLLLGVALAEPVAMPLAAEAMRAGLIVNAANDSTIRMAPPLIIGDAEVDEFADKFSRALDAVASTRR